jgi:hypothetical protein
MDSNVATSVFILEVFTVVLWLWAFISMLLLPSWAYRAAGKSKALWAVLLLVALVMPLVGLVLCVWFIFSTSTKVRRQAQVDDRIGFPGGPPLY